MQGLTISVQMAFHSVLEGHIIRCSNNNGVYIVGCQMPEDNPYIKDYVETQLKKGTQAFK